MADPRTFVLIGNFTDNITPALEKINKSLAQVKSNLESVSKSTKPLQKDFKDLASFSNDFAKSLKGQASDIRDVTRAMKAMRNEMGRVNRAYRAGSRNRGIVPPLPPPPRPPRGAAPPPPPPPPRAPRYQPPQYGYGGGGRGGRGGGGGGYGAAVGGAVFGTQLSQMMTSAIVAGFQMGTSIMVKPFQYIMSGMAERIADEMSDVRAAGGLYAINRLLTEQGKQGFLTGGFREAEEVTKENNRYLAKLAGSLPGDTQEYIQVSKQISDGIYRVLSEDKENFMKLGVRVATEEGRLAQAKEIQGGGTKGMQAAGTEVLGEMTKLTVLAGLGGRQGAFGLPQLTERMIAQQQVSMGQMQRYSAIFRDPMIMGALERNISKINQTQANTADRLDKIRGMFQEVVTPELVARYRRTTAGVLESMRTTFLNPEVGLLGLGRPIDGLGKKLNDFGQYLDKQNKVVEDVTLAASADISIFEGLRDTFAFLYQTLEPIIEILPLIYDPLKELGLELEKVREVTASVFKRFNEYRVFFEEMGGEFKGTARLRASLATLTQLFKDFGIFDSADFNRFQEIISGKGFNVDKAGALVQEMLEKFFDSDLAESIGNAIGRLAGTIIKTVGQTAAQAAGIVSAGGIAKGLSEGFEAAGGREGIRLIFKSLIELILKAVRELFAAAPLEMSLITGFALFGPALAATLGTMLGAKLIAVIPTIAKGLVSVIAASLLKTKAVKVTDLGSVITDPRRMLPAAPGSAPGAIAPYTGAGAAGGAFSGAISRLLLVLGKLTLVLLAITVIGGGVESTLRQLGQFFGELGHNISGAFGGLFDLLGVLGGFVGDVGRRFGDLIAPIFGLSSGFDGLKLVLAPITLAFQAFSMGLRGLALAFAELRVFLARITGDPEYQKRIQERDKMAADLSADRGRINAYNASMLGPEALKKQLNDAVFELQNSTTLKAARSAELKAFIAEARGQRATQPAATPAPSPVFTAGTTPAAVSPSVPTVPAEIKQTATNTQQLNQKAATQVTHAAGIKIEAAGTKKNTATANTTLGNIRAGIIAISNKLSGIQSALLGDLNNIQAGVNKISSLLASGKLKVDMGIPGGPLGGGSGGPAIFGNMASSFGLTMTSGYRPGDDGYHGINRARDYSNGSGPTPQMMAFAQYLASTYGRSLKELIYTPLGYSIKDGQKVPPYAQSSHYNHVHVAYALGAGNPAFFNDQKDAVAWEKKFLGKGIDSITTNTAEIAGSKLQYGSNAPKTPKWMQLIEQDYQRSINKPINPGLIRNSGRGGLDWWEGPSTSHVPPGSLQPESSRSSLASAPINITAPISITQQPGQSADELASIVALKIGEAVADARAASIFV